MEVCRRVSNHDATGTKSRRLGKDHREEQKRHQPVHINTRARGLAVLLCRILKEGVLPKETV